jgi:hypothetical protein
MFRVEAHRAALLGDGRLPFFASTVYVAVLAIVVERGREPSAWLFALLAMAIAVAAVSRRTAVARYVGWGAAVVVATLGPERSSRALDVCAAIGVWVAVAGACIAMARIPADGGVVRSRPRSGRVEAAVVAGAFWLAIVAAVTSNGSPRPLLGLPPEAWRWGAFVVSLGALIFACVWPLRFRRLELATAARAHAARALVVTCAVVGLVVAVLGEARADTVARVVLTVAAALVAAVALAGDVVRVARVARRIVTLALFGGIVALIGATAVSARAGDTWTLTLVTASITLAIGAIVVRLEGPMRPAGGAWLDAFVAAAEDATLHPEPEDAMRAALLALRTPLGLGAPPAELWMLAPMRLLVVDAAGYLHEREAVLPVELAELAAAEPEGALRADVLASLEVRRPELRAAARWMADRRSLVVAAIAAQGETEGVLVLPRGSRTEPVTLEEVRALRRVTDRLAGACRARASEARMLARVQDLTARAEAAEQSLERVIHERALETGRHALAAGRLARPASLGTYAAASRMALEALERRAAVSAPIAIVAPSGVDPVPYLARVHLGGARAANPLVVVDATSAVEHDPARWSAPNTSPLALADGGMLVLLDGAALPMEVQRLVARACAEARVPWERPDRLDLQLALTGVERPEASLAAGRLDASLAARLGDACSAPVHLPRLAERPEDFRALLMDRLAREGLRTRGRPVGIEPAAYAKLAEYSFPGEDAEFAAVIQRLVARSTGDAVTAPDVDAILVESATSSPRSATAVARPSRGKSDSRDSKRRKDPISA